MSVVFRVDASSSIGLGHLMRCLQLASELSRRGATCTFLSAEADEDVRAIVHEREHTLESLDVVRGSEVDRSRTIAATKRQGARLLVLDGYAFDSGYVATVGDGGAFVCVVDDMGDRELRCNAILNHNFHAASLEYRAPDDCLRMLGPTYGIVGDNFVQARTAARSYVANGSVRILITMGGADPTRESEKVLRAVDGITAASLDVRVLVGPANPFADLIAASAVRARHRVEVVRAPRDMALQMAWCDIAVSAAGTTCMELACVGVPAVVVAVAENQLPVAEEVERRRLMRSVGFYATATEERLAGALDALIRDAEARRSMVEAQHALVDGLGKQRVATRLLAAVEDRGAPS